MFHRDGASQYNATSLPAVDRRLSGRKRVLRGPQSSAQVAKDRQPAASASRFAAASTFASSFFL